MIEYSERIEQDIPDTCMFAKFSIANVLNIKESDSAVMPFKAQLKEGAKVDSVNWVGAASNLDLSQSQHEQFNDLKLGRFKQRVLSAFVL